MIRRFLLASVLGLGALASGCAADTDDLGETEDQLVSPPVVSVDGVPGSALVVRAGVLQLTFAGPAKVETRGAEQVLVLSGRTNRNVASVRSFVPDDAFGEVVMKGPRSFDVVLRGGHEINTVLSGLPLGLAIEATTGSPRSYQAALELGAVFGPETGDTKLRVDEIVPVAAGTAADPLRYRARIETTATPTAITLDTLAAGTTVLKRSARRYDADLTFAAFLPTTFAASPVTFTAAYTSGPARTEARPVVGLRRLGLTTKTIEESFPRTCAAAVRTCVQRIARANGTDFGECGRYREVQACQNEEPPPPADTRRAETRIEADILAQTGVSYDTSILTQATTNGRTLALAALPRGGSAEFSLTATTIGLERFEARPQFLDTSLVSRFQAQLASLGHAGAAIVAHGMTQGGQPLWHFVIDERGTRSTLAVLATSATTSQLVGYTYDERAFRELAGHLLVRDTVAMASQAGLYAELEVYLRASRILATDAGFALSTAGNTVSLTATRVWGDLAVTVSVDRTTGQVRVAHEN